MARFKAENFKVLNKDNTAVVYRTPDRNYNRLIFSITNKSANNIELKGGAEPSVFGFNMSFISDKLDVISQLRVTPPAGWEATAVTVQTWVEWRLTCKQDTQLAPGANLSIIIENILCENEKPGYFTITNHNIPGYDNSGSLPPALFLSVLRPPIDPTKANPVPFTAGYTNVVHPIANQTIHPNNRTFTENEAIPAYITYDGNALIRNGFKLILTNNNEKPIVLAGESDRPVVTISFLFGEEDYDITTQALGDRQITIGVTSDKWTPMGHTDGSPSWQFYPQLPQHIDGYKTVDFIIENIVTPVNVPAEKISLMYVQVNRFADFDDKVFIFQLNKKKAKAVMKPLSADNPRIKIGDDVKLTWSSSLAKRVTITYDDRDGNQILLDTAATDPDKKIELDAKNYKLLIKPTAETTQFEAIAFDTAASPDTQKAHVTVEQRPARINAFKATKQLINQGAKTKVTFSWEVQDVRQLILKRKGTDEKIVVTGTTSKEIDVETACEYQLLAYSYGTTFPAPDEKALKIFSHGSPHPIAEPALSGERTKRPAILLNDHPNIKRAFIQHTAKPARFSTIFEINTDTSALEKKHPGSCFALSPSGNKLAYYTPGLTKRGIVLYDIASQEESLTETQDLIETMKFSSDGRKLFVSFEPGMLTGADEQTNADVDSSSDGQRFTTYFTCDPDKNILVKSGAYTPIGGGEATDIAFDNKPSMVYFTSFVNRRTDTNIYLVKYDNGEKGSPDAINTLNTRPVMLKQAKKSSKIYAAFERRESIFDNADAVIIINTDNNTISTVTVGEYPIDMILTADEKTLYVACIIANKVVAVDTETLAVRDICTSVDSPSCIALSSDGEIMFVGNYATRTITMVDVKKAMVLGTVATGTNNGNPYGMVITENNDGYKVFVAKDGSGLIRTTPNINLEITDISILKPKV